MLIKTSWNKLWRLRCSNQWRSLECHKWNKVKDFVILIVIFSVLVEWKYNGRVFYNKKNIWSHLTFSVVSGWLSWTKNVILTFRVTNWVWTSPLRNSENSKLRSSHRRCAVKKISVPKNFANFTGKQLCWSLFLIKLQAWTLLKRTSAKDCV